MDSCEEHRMERVSTRGENWYMHFAIFNRNLQVFFSSFDADLLVLIGTGATYFIQVIIGSQRILCCQHSRWKHNATQDNVAEIAVIAKPVAEDAKSVEIS